MSWLSPELDYVQSILDCRSVDQVWSIYSAKMLEFGFDRLIFAVNRFRASGDFGDPSDALILTNHEKSYIDIFLGQELYIKAPMAVWVVNNLGSCSWQWAENRRKNGQNTDSENKILDLNERMGITAGYSISFADISERSTSGIGLCAKRGLTQAEVDDIWSRVGSEIETYSKVMNHKICTLPFERPGTPLTDRQREALQWVADGKTVQDVATILGLGQATVEKHLRRARENLNAETTAQAVLKASIQNQFFLFRGNKGKAGAEYTAINVKKLT